MESTYKFEYPADERSIIKVIGVGGGGSNAVNQMYERGIRGVDFYVCNTDVQALNSSPVANKIQIGENLTKGLGAGANPEKGKNAALESKDEIREILNDGTKMIFITAGMGGGTGTGAAPVIAEIAKELNILTVGIVTMPFSFEGTPKRKRAEKGYNQLREYCDTVLVILNNRIKEVFGGVTMKEAFAQADNVLTKGAKAIAEIITVSGTINVDFEDVRTVMQDSGVAVMGSAVIEGEDRARLAVEAALTSPLLNNTNIFGAKYILLSIVVGDEENFQFEELEEITEYVQQQAGEEAEIIFGQATDSTLAQGIGVTVIATGFEENDKILEPSKKVFDLVSNKQLKKPTALKTEKLSDYDDEADFFERAEPEVKQPLARQEIKPKNEKVVFRLDEEYDFGDSKLDDRKREVLEDRLEERKENINNLKTMYELSSEELQEKKDVPAYMRKNVKLTETPHSSDSQVSRMKLNEDNELLGGNRFLHDNVD